MTQNSQFVKEPLAMHRRDSNDALHPSYEGGKSFMLTNTFLEDLPHSDQTDVWLQHMM